MQDHLLKLPLLTHLTFLTYENNIDIGDLPPSLTHLVLPYNYNQSVDNLPPNLTHLTLGKGFNSPINSLPTSLINLDFSCGYFIHSIENIPNSITQLVLGHYFNQPITDLPPLLTHLTIGYWFNQSIDSLPKSITHLRIQVGGLFKQEYTCLPPHLVELEISSVPIGFQLPHSLISLEVNNQPQGNPYPPNLKHLAIYNYSQKLDFMFPASLESFLVESDWTRESKHLSLFHLSPNIRKLDLRIPCVFPETLPHSLQELHFRVDAKTTPNAIETIFSLPNLTRLSLNITTLNHIVPQLQPLSLPPKLAILVILGAEEFAFDKFVRMIDFCSAPLRELSLSGPAQMPNLPSTIVELDISDFTAWNKLPPNLKSLIIQLDNTSNEFPLAALPLPELPSNLQSLQMKLRSMDSAEVPLLPQSLRSLVCKNFFITPSTPLPPFLTQLSVASKFKEIPPLALTLEYVDIEFLE